jgi:lambda repressor-like predicted transcriptional regulator
MKRWHHERAHGLLRTQDAGPAADHVQRLLAAGWSLRSIADAAGCAPQVVCRLKHRQQPRITNAVAQRLFAVTDGTILTRGNDDGFVRNLGARRRIEALLALGWRHTEITAAMAAADPSVRTTSQLVKHQIGNWIGRRTHDAVCAAYDQLALRPGPSTVTRNRSLKAGYAPPLAWDDEDLDNPDAQPAGVDTDRKPNRKQKLPPVEDLLFLLETGESIAAIASRYGASEDGVLAALRRAPAA